MKNEPEPNRDDALLDAVLGGDTWPELNAAAKNAALAEFHVVQRRRRVRIWLAQAAAIMLLAAGVAWWPHATTTAPAPKPTTFATNNMTKQATAIPTQTATALTAKPVATGPHYISEAEMLALFPQGSCTIAEVNGQQQLLFFDHKVEEEGAPYHPGS
ncbi:MAG TPA: hypothetical protein VK737_02405 [Opitutales bacterium]|jgi:hypothetical protein|nr:hypothetical protein [Opitutales bacterium]